MKAVTIGLPVFNGQRFLRACLDSLQAQTFGDFELIVSDNASTDGTPDIVADYARHDPRIRFERSLKNEGAAWNHRRVLGLARTPYFKWCGADDVCHPEFLATCFAAVKERPDAVLAYPRTEVIDENGAPVARTNEQLPLDSPDPVCRFGALMSAISITHNPYYGVVRRELFSRVRPLGTFLASDRCLLSQLALLGPFIEVPHYLLSRRWHDGNNRNQHEEQRFYQPTAPARPRAREWRVLWEHGTAILRAPVSGPTKLRLYSRLARWVVKERSDLAAEARALLRQRLA